MFTETPIKKDKQTITKEGNAISPRIEDVKIKRLNPIEDKRGEMLEVFRPSWGFHSDPLVYVYQVRTKPKQIRGWVVHKEQDDRIFFCVGSFRVVLFDYRKDSPTFQLLNDFVFSERNPTLITFPVGVFHAVQNIGTSDAIFINMPTKPYNHENPDKYRLPIENDVIPFSFED